MSEPSRRQESSCRGGFCLLIILVIVLFALTCGLKYLKEAREDALVNSRGTVTIVVTRMMSMYLFDDRAPDLKLEVQFRKEIQHSGVYVNRSEAQVLVPFSFYDVGWHDAILFRLKDVFPAHRPNRGILALSPSQMDFKREKIYLMSPESNWLVIEFKWKENE